MSGIQRRTREYILSIVFLFLLSLLSYSVDTPHTWNGVKKIVVIADIHGDYNNFERILKGTRLVDEELNWTGRETHFVQLGDILDRGPDAKRAFDLLMKLETQAEAAGGKVHFIIGNHEEGNIVGTALMTSGYVTVEQFTSFLPEDYRESLEKKVKKKHAQSGDTNPSLAEKLHMFWDEARKENTTAQAQYLKNFYKHYGKWILTKNTVIKINDIVFTHGGVSEEFSRWDFKKTNNLLRDELKKLYGRIPLRSKLRMAYQPNAPHWFRDLIRSDEEDFAEDVTRILDNLKAAYMVIGHTVRQSEVIASKKLDRFQGRIWGIDTGISRYYGGHLCALIIDEGKFMVWWGNDEN